MTASETYNILKAAAERTYDPREAAAAAHFLLERVWGVSRLQLALEPEQELEQPTSKLLSELAAGRPVQYIAGEAPFCGMWLAVREGVLIPRPETEELVAWVTAEASGRILDVGTGSGAIAIALAKCGFRVAAVDISEDALTIARENAAAQGVEVSFLQCDILRQTPPETDVIVSNPPYIPLAARAAMHRNVLEHEPHSALFVPDDDPLIFYRAVARLGVRELFFEIYDHLGTAVCDLLRSEGYDRVELRQDINGRDRMVRARRL